MRWSCLMLTFALLLQVIAAPCATRCMLAHSADSHRCCPSDQSGIHASACCPGTRIDALPAAEQQRWSAFPSDSTFSAADPLHLAAFRPHFIALQGASSRSHPASPHLILR